MSHGIHHQRVCKWTKDRCHALREPLAEWCPQTIPLRHRHEIAVPIHGILLRFHLATSTSRKDGLQRYKEGKTSQQSVPSKTQDFLQGNPLTRRPCQGDEFEIMIFEAKGQNAGIYGICQKMFAIWTFISIGRCVTQVKKMRFGLRGELILLFKGKKKTFEI